MKKFNGFMNGVNLGGWFSQCDYSQQRLDNFITEKDFKTIRDWGLDHVRLPIDYNIVENDDGTIKEDGYNRIQKAFDFCKKYDFKPIIVHNALKIIENQGAIALSDAFQNPSRLIVKVGRDTLYDYQLRHPELDDFIQTLLRIYGGIFSEYGKIEETLIASRLGVDVKQVVDILQFLTKQDLVDYIPYSDSPKITFTHAVSNKKYMFSDESFYKQRKKIAHEYLDYITAYVTNTSKCRSSMLLQYFGEDNNNKCCGICDYCRKRRRDIKNAPTSEEVINTICEKLRSHDATSDELCALFPDIEQHSMIDIIRWLIDYGIVRGNSDGSYHLVAS